MRAYAPAAWHCDGRLPGDLPLDHGWFCIVIPVVGICNLRCAMRLAAGESCLMFSVSAVISN
jgi:hypothetical protein